jgi:hypothetical protein
MFPMETIVNPPSRGSRLDADHPRNGVLIPRRFSLGSEPALGKPVDALSIGYRRRFLLALGLLAPRPVLLMDEPFDGFDLHQTRGVMNLLRQEAVASRTLVLSIHELGDAERMRPARAPQRWPRDGGRHLGRADSGHPVADRHRSGSDVPCAHMIDARP